MVKSKVAPCSGSVALRQLNLVILLAIRFKAFDRVWHLVFFTILIVMEFQVRYLAILVLFSAIDSVRWFGMEVFTRIPS